MIKYIIEKIICDDYAHGCMVLTDENGNPMTFTTEDEANNYLCTLKISAGNITEFYNIKPCII